MFGLLLFLHIVSFSVWLGASLTFMVWGRSSKNAGLEVWAHTWSTLALLQRAVVVPACLVATGTGILLTMNLVKMHFDMGSAMWLMLMQIIGVLAALVTLALAAPLAARMGVLAARSLEKGTREESAEAVRRRLAAAGTAAGILMIVAIYFGALKPVL